MSTVKEVIEIRSKYDLLKKQEEELTKEMNTIFNNINIEEFEQLTYEECKDIFEIVIYRIDEEIKNKLHTILTKKKEEVYPEILKAHYYPELNSLDIPNEDNIEIDNFVRHHIRHIFIDRLIKECKPLLDNIEKLVDLGILKKYYSFKCEECGDTSESLSSEELKGYKRIWEIESIIKNQGYSDKLDLELDDLYKIYSYGCIELYCMECDEMHKEITNLSEFEEYSSEGHVETYYKVDKNPDLTYEKL